MILPAVSWTIDGISTPLIGWSATTTAFGGMGQMRGTIRELDARRIPSSVTQGSLVKGFTDGGSVVFEGRLSAPPAIRGGLASFAAQGESIRAVKRATRLPYQTRDYSVLTPIQSNPHNYGGVNANKISASVNHGGLYFEIAVGESIAVGDVNGVALWIPGHSLNRYAFDWIADRSASTLLRILVSKATGPSGSGTTVTTHSLAATSGTVDQTVTSPTDLLTFNLECNGATPIDPTYQLLIRNFRVNGIASGDTFTGSEVVNDVGGRLGYDVSTIGGTSLNVLPLDWTSGSWAELLSYIATLEDRYWRVVEDRGSGPRLEFDSWGAKEWTVYQADGATVDLTPLELYNQVTVKYVDVGGAPREVTRTCADLGIPDPLAATGQINVWPESLSDVQADSTLATAIANNLLPRVSSLREQGRIDCVKAYDSTGREAVREMRAGDTVRVADRDMNTASVHRIFEAENTPNGVSLGIEQGVSIAAMLARAGLVGARAPSTAQLPELPPPGPVEEPLSEERQQWLARYEWAQAHPKAGSKYR